MNIYLAQQKYSAVGLLGTDRVMQSRFYGGLGSVEVLVPPDSELEAVHKAYVGMAIDAKATQSQRDIMFNAGRKLTERGAETILLGGTDLLLAFEGQSPDFFGDRLCRSSCQRNCDTGQSDIRAGAGQSCRVTTVGRRCHRRCGVLAIPLTQDVYDLAIISGQLSCNWCLSVMAREINP